MPGGPGESHRVDGLIEVTRALGDVWIKDKISCDPDIYSFDLVPEHKLLILATDGLWDTVNAMQAVRTCTSFIPPKTIPILNHPSALCQCNAFVLCMDPLVMVLLCHFALFLKHFVVRITGIFFVLSIVCSGSARLVQDGQPRSDGVRETALFTVLLNNPPAVNRQRLPVGCIATDHIRSHVCDFVQSLLLLVALATPVAVTCSGGYLCANSFTCSPSFAELSCADRDQAGIHAGSDRTSSCEASLREWQRR